MSISKKKSKSVQETENKSLTSGDVSGTASSFEGVISASAGEALNIDIQQTGIDPNSFFNFQQEQTRGTLAALNQATGANAAIAQSTAGAQTGAERLLSKFALPGIISAAVVFLIVTLKKSK